MEDTKYGEQNEAPAAQPLSSDTLRTVNAMRGAVRTDLDVWQRTERIIDALKYTDEASGFSICGVEQSDLAQEEIDDRNAILHFDLESGRHLTLTVRDREGRDVGTYTKNLFVARDHQLFIEDYESIMKQGGTGFGTRFQQHMEQAYRSAGVTAAFRGCGLSVGRYEGAKFGYDFFLPEQRNRFAGSFVQFLSEQGVQEVTFSGRAMSLDSLTDVLRTPQDFLAVHADRSMTYILDGQKQECPANQAGKAFFLDQESEAKKELDPDNPYRGKWTGIKSFAS